MRKLQLTLRLMESNPRTFSLYIKLLYPQDSDCPTLMHRHFHPAGFVQPLNSRSGYPNLLLILVKRQHPLHFSGSKLCAAHCLNSVHPQLAKLRQTVTHQRSIRPPYLTFGNSRQSRNIFRHPLPPGQQFPSTDNNLCTLRRLNNGRALSRSAIFRANQQSLLLPINTFLQKHTHTTLYGRIR